MSQQNWTTPPHGQAYPQGAGPGQGFQQPGHQQQPWGGQPPASRPNNTVWWVVIGLAAVALVGILLHALLGGGDDGPATPGQPPATVPATPSGGDETVGGGEEPGPGTDPGSVSVAGATMPDTLGGYTKASEEAYEDQGVLASYEGADQVYATIEYADPTLLPEYVAGWEERRSISGFECGLDMPLAVVGDEVAEGIPTCAAAARDGVVVVSSETLAVEDLAPLLDELLGTL